MSVEYLLVVYQEDRDALAEGDRVVSPITRSSSHPGEYTITLGGGYAPASVEVVLAGTSIMRPKVVVFT
jgi:hypothetical protein